MKKKVYILLLPVFFISTVSSQTVSFYKENLVMKLDASHMTVSDELNFRNNYAAVADQTVFYSLPLATSDLKIDSVAIFNESDQTCISHFRKLPAGIFFQLSFQGHEQLKIKIIYIIDHNGKTFHYPVMTNILYWKSALPQGSYTLQVEDPAITIDSASFKPDGVIADRTPATYSWHKSNFKPDKELDIWFHKK
jgi:hypothetical protein